MAESAEDAPRDNNCQSCHSSEAWYACLDCDKSCHQLCKDCHRCHRYYHVTSRHRVVDINEFRKNPLLYELATPTACQRHGGKRLLLICKLCKHHLCLMCPHDDTVICFKSSGGTSKHVTELMESVASLDRDEIAQSLSVAASRVGTGERFLAGLGKGHRKLHRMENRTKASISQQVEKYKQAAENRGKALELQLQEAVLPVESNLAASHDNTLHYLENIQRSCDEGDALRINPIDLEVLRLTPSLVARLTAPFDFTMPELPSIKFKPSSVQTELDGLDIALGSIETGLNPTEEGYNSTEEVDSDTVFTQAPLLEKDGNKWFPTERCTVETAVGMVTVEAHGIRGLHTASVRRGRNMISDEGKEYYGVCTSMDNRLLYGTTGGKRTIVMYATIQGKLVSIFEVSVNGAKSLNGIRAGSVTGKLVVVDTLFPRLTVHSPDGAILKEIGKLLGDNVSLRQPLRAEWSPCEEYLYIVDAGKENGKTSVTKFRVSSMTVVWRKLLKENTLQIRAIDDEVYVTHADKPKVTVFSTEGVYIKSISCPGRVREVRRTTPARQLELVWY